jgi:hypothetical protein
LAVVLVFPPDFFVTIFSSSRCERRSISTGSLVTILFFPPAPEDRRLPMSSVFPPGSATDPPV